MKQQYKGFTLYINDTHFGMEKLVEDVTTWHEHERPRVDGCTDDEYIGALKLEVDLIEALDNIAPKGNPAKRDVYLL